MKEHDLLEAVGGIDEKYIMKARNAKEKKAIRSHIKWIYVAACLAVIVAVTGVVGTNMNWFNSGNDAGSGVDVDGTFPEGIDPIIASIAVYPPAEARLEDVADAILTELTEDEAYSFEVLGEHLPTYIPDGYYFRNSSVYVTTMKDGTKYYLLRVDFTTGDENIADYSVQLTSYAYDPEMPEYTIDTIPEDLDNSFFHVLCGEIHVGMDAGELSRKEMLSVLRSIQ